MDKVAEKLTENNWFIDLPWESLGPVLLALLGYAVVHYFSSIRDSRNKKREIRAKFLTDSYQKLARVVSSPNQWEFDDLRSVLIEIQLMGTNSQIKKAEDIALRFPVAMSNPDDSSVDLEPLLIDIRDDLRKELAIEKTKSVFIWLKY
ncbi:TPA: hypothetical protein ACPVZF_000241 [Vibrio parahaemolyticus]